MTSMTRYRITTPVAGFSGEIAGVHFAKGAAEVEAPEPLQRPTEGKELNRAERAERDRIGQDPMYRAMAYFRAQGYGVEQLDDKPGQEPTPAPEIKVPARSASKADWVTYAVEHGDMTREDAEKLNRDELADKLGRKES